MLVKSPYHSCTSLRQYHEYHIVIQFTQKLRAQLNFVIEQPVNTYGGYEIFRALKQIEKWIITNWRLSASLYTHYWKSKATRIYATKAVE